MALFSRTASAFLSGFALGMLAKSKRTNSDCYKLLNG